MHRILLPRLTENDASATLVVWAVPDGSRVGLGDIVCSIETSKATFDIAAEADGFLRCRAEPGRECAVREVLGFISETPDEPAPELEWLPLPESPPAEMPEGERRATLKARRLADKLSVDLSALHAEGVIRENDVRAAAASKRPVRRAPVGRRFNATILGTGSYIPERTLTNDDVIGIGNISTSDEWIRAKVGVATRHFAADDEATSDLAVIASERALEAADVSAEQLGLIIVATTVPDHVFPATACIVQARLGAANAMAFDAMAMCTGTVYALDIARRYIEDGSVEYALVIGSEVYSRILDFTDRSTCIYFGDGAGSMVVGRAAPGEDGVITSFVRNDGSSYETLIAPAGGTRMPATHETVDSGLHYLRMDPKGVWNFATRVFPDAVRTVVERAGLQLSDVDMVIPHQSNVNIIKSGMDALGLPMTKTHLTLEKYGNTSAASVAITLDEAVREGRIGPGDLIVLVGYGGGLAWGAAAVRWTASGK